MMVNFIPDKQMQPPAVPFFEDITARDIPGCRTKKSVESLQKEIVAVLKRLDCGNIIFQSGKTADRPPRSGYQIHFTYLGHKGRIDCVALPVRNPYGKNPDRALAQALYLVRNSLEAQLYSSVYQPGYAPIAPYLIGEKGRTVMEALVESGMLPLLADGR